MRLFPNGRADCCLPVTLSRVHVATLSVSALIGKGDRVIGELYEHALAGRAAPEIEHTDGTRTPLPVANWLRTHPGDASPCRTDTEF